MKIETKIDVSVALGVASTLLHKLPYALNSAITRTAKEAVEAGRQEVARDLTVRKKFILNRIRILQYSRVGNLVSVLGVDKNVQGSPLLLGFFEAGGMKEPLHGADLAIPITGGLARPQFAQSVKPSLRYPNLRMVGGKGKRRTFLIPGIGIFERVSPGRTSAATPIVYSFRPSAPLRSLTHLRKVMEAVIQNRFRFIFGEEFTREVLHAAGKA